MKYKCHLFILYLVICLTSWSYKFVFLYFHIPSFAQKNALGPIKIIDKSSKDVYIEYVRRKIGDLTSKTFGRLTVVEFDTKESELHKQPMYRCVCNCGSGKIVITRASRLSSGTIKSCGCIQSMKNWWMAELNRKWQPHIAVAKVVFCQAYNDGTITFDDFYRLSQMNCFYCNIEPSNIRTIKSNDASEFFKHNGIFTYNGLDKINNDKGHTLNNCVSCCKECNYSKRNMTLDEFYNMINNIVLNTTPLIIPDYKTLYETSNHDWTKFKTAKWAMAYHYTDTNFDFEFLSFMCSLKCFYCGHSGLNYTKKAPGLNWNGLDRIDQTKPHTLNNIVPCCKFCNFAKTKRSMQEFIAWANRVYNYSRERKNSNSRSLGLCPKKLAISP